MEPRLLAIVFADSAYRINRPNTQKKALIGLFDTIFGTRFPMLHASGFVVYFKVDFGSDQNRKLPLLLKLIDVDQGKTEMTRIPVDVPQDTGKPYFEGIVEVGQIVLTHPGEYSWHVMLGDLELGRASIFAKVTPAQASAPEG